MTETCDFVGFEDLLEHDWTGVIEEQERDNAMRSEVTAALSELIRELETVVEESVAVNVIDLTKDEESKVVGVKRVYELIDLTDD